MDVEVRRQLTGFVYYVGSRDRSTICTDGWVGRQTDKNVLHKTSNLVPGIK